MKAAVLHSFQTPPRFEDFPKPTAAPGEVLLEMRASPLTPIAKSAAAGLHVSAPREFPAVVGLEGVGTLPDGPRVYTNDFHWPQGGMAEYAITSHEHCVPVPGSLTDEMAAALPNPALSSWLALVHRAEMRRGESVLVLGATGLSGKLAIPIAKHLGAGHLVAVGRNEQVLRTLPDLGADATVSLLQPEAALAESLVKAGTRGRFDIVLDYLWGRTAELVLLLLRGHVQPNPGSPTRFVCLGSAAGPTATLTSAAFRNSNIELLGSGAGNLPPDAARRVLPDLWSLAEKVRLPIEIERVPLSDVTHAWGLPDRSGLRRVVVP